MLAFLFLLAGVGAPARAQLSDPSAPRASLIAYLNALAESQHAQRKRNLAEVRTRAAAERRQATAQETILRLIGGLPDERAPLAVQSFGVVPGDGFRIEKLAYESLPGFRVTANLYVPTRQTGPFPAVLLTPGHDPSGKLGQYAFAANLARAGIAALAYDPISEGERTQYYDPELGASKVGRVTGEHSHAGVQTLLIGDHIARYFIWDAVRGIDYLASRSDIDAERIGAFGCSGGGTVTAYLAAFDERVKAVATACYITTFQALLASGDPQEGEQSIPDFLKHGLDLADWVEMAAPRPYAIVSTVEDLFPFAGASESFEEARRIYGLYGAADRLQWITAPGGHGALGPVSADIIGFFTRWLLNEPPRATFQPMRAPRPDDLLVTPTGQLSTSIGSETVFSLNRKRAEARAAPRSTIRNSAELTRLQARLRDDIRTIAAVSATPGAAAPAARVLGTTTRPGYRLDRVEIRAEEGITLAALLAVPAGTGAKPTLLMMDPRPSEALAAPGGEADRLARAGWIVMLLQPRGTPGGTEEIKSPLLGTSYLLSLRALLVGKTILGMRTDDAIRAVDWLHARPDVDRSALALYGTGPLGAVALHAAALDPRIRKVYVENTLAAYRMAVDRPIHRDLPEIALPGVLRRYDLGDLLVAIGPRPVRVINPVNSVGERIREDAFRKALGYVFDSDRQLGWPDRIRVLSRDPREPLPVD